MAAAAGVVVVLGVGNRLLSDDAVGPLAIEELSARHVDRGNVMFVDGGTMGLSLLPEIERGAAFIAIDAARMGVPPGTVQVFEGPAMDRQLGGRRKTAHEVALGDLLAAAALSGSLPERRALVAVEPQTTGLGTAPSPVVAAAMPRMRAAVEDLLQRWC